MRDQGDMKEIKTLVNRVGQLTIFGKGKNRCTGEIKIWKLNISKMETS